jgi:hypothetical protein
VDRGPTYPMPSDEHGELQPSARALAAALNEPHNGTTRMHAVLEALIDRAAKGDMPAIREIFRRRDIKSGPMGTRVLPADRVNFRWPTEDEPESPNN